MPSNSRAKRPQDVHERALGLLAVRPRSRRELADRLRRAGFDAAEVAEETARLEGVGLIDDEDFARQVVEHELRVRRSANRAVVSRLLTKGLDRWTIDRVVAETAAEPEDARAVEVARERARRLSGVPIDRAYGRLVPFLLRRGFSSGTARRAAGIALGVDGADQD